MCFNIFGLNIVMHLWALYQPPPSPRYRQRASKNWSNWFESRALNLTCTSVCNHIVKCISLLSDASDDDWRADRPSHRSHLIQSFFSAIAESRVTNAAVLSTKAVCHYASNGFHSTEAVCGCVYSSIMTSTSSIHTLMKKCETWTRSVHDQCISSADKIRGK